MDLPTTLAFHVREFVDGLGLDSDDPTDALTGLAEELDAAVSAYLGLRLSLVLDGWPVTLTAFPTFAGRRPVTSLRVNLSSFGRGFEPASQIVFYAGIPGTFVDLAADLAYLHGRTPVALDVELPPPTVVPGFTGLAEYATINRALGVLLARGQDLDDARAALLRGASATGMDVAGHAARLLQECARDGGLT